MKKLFLSAFAVSLMIASSGTWSQTEGVDEFLGLEEELLPELKGEQKFTPAQLHQDKTWNIDEKTVEIDTPPLKGQSYSIIPWDTQSTDDFLDINLWINERKLKDQMPDWKTRLRHDRHYELMGKIMACRGSCLIYRGVNAARGQHLSGLKEGDELHVGKASVAWVFMMDGTLMRVASESSVTFQEVNVSTTEIFFHLRLNQGHAFWHPRHADALVVDDAPETDAFSLPILVKEANLQYFERDLFKKGNDADHLKEILSQPTNQNAVTAQFENINKRKVANSPALTVKSRVMMVAPNATLVASKVSFDLLYQPGGQSFFKKRTAKEGEEFSVTLRGYNDVTPQTISDSTWQEVDAGGKTVGTISEDKGILQISELLTKRIQTFELAREVWIEAYTLPLWKALPDAKTLAMDHGYVLWNDMSQRFHFLSEYTRRIETTNLKSVDNLLTKLDKAGTPQGRELSPSIYQPALNDYLKGLKSRYTEKNLQVRQMSDVQYYVWILRHAKL